MDSIAKYGCPVCGLSNMPFPPRDYNICPCCGTEFGLDDDMFSHRRLRNRWLESGARWFSNIDPYTQPPAWNAYDQLDLAGYDYDVEPPRSPVQTDAFVSGGIPFVPQFWTRGNEFEVKAA